MDNNFKALKDTAIWSFNFTTKEEKTTAFDWIMKKGLYSNTPINNYYETQFSLLGRGSSKWRNAGGQVW